MRNNITLSLLLPAAFVSAQTISSPDGKLQVHLSMADNGCPQYSVTYDNVTVLEASALGLKTTLGDFTSGLTLANSSDVKTVSGNYSLPNAKKHDFEFEANEQTFTYTHSVDRRVRNEVVSSEMNVWDVTFHVDNNNVAFRYKVYPLNDRLACLVNEEATAYVMPEATTTFLCPQMTPQTGFARTAPSYETFYEYDAEMGKNGHGRGYTFPALFKANDLWVMLCETNVGGNYCASRIENRGGSKYQLAYPEDTEFGGVGTSAPGLMLPDYTPWRTITVGRTMAPIAETSIMWDLVEPQYAPSQDYSYGKSTWSWVIRMDASCNYDEQKEYIDFAAALGWQFVLIDAWWDANIGYDRMKELSAYAATKGVGLFLWYNSNGYWNDAPQGPRGKMHRMLTRREEMKWLKEAGIKGLKVDFVGSDKQQTMQMYEDIMVDANDAGLMLIFHGCTIPRGWERMYPNFVACEAARVSENLAFGQYDNDMEAVAATILPVLRNAIGNMDFGGSTLNKHYSKNNERGTLRKTSDVYALATAVLFQSPVQNFALAPNNLTDAPAWAVDFMKEVPTSWHDMHYVDGYPGKYLIMARQDMKGNWYLAGINAQKEPLKVKLNLDQWSKGEELRLYLNNEIKTIKVNKKQVIEVTIPTDGGVLICK